MLQQLKEEDFLVLRGPFESKRQGPKAMAGVLLFAIPFQGLFLLFEYLLCKFSIYPQKEEIFSIHLSISIISAVVSIIFAIPYIYMRFQKLQYLLNTLVSQNLAGVSPYLLSLMLIGESISPNTSELLTLTYITLIIGIIIFIATSIRFYILLKKGKYRKGTKKDYQRRKFEGKSLLPIAIPAGVGIVFIIQYLIRTFDFNGIDTMVMSVFMIGIFYTMLFVLPEQLVLQYCKIRFDSFNYERNGRLKPVRDENGNIIMD
ncbi:hypothetical protein [Paraliobacillus ryukyuensis]|uniref:hypothetical protein n=1 Tax=Paraliobacillus ryukyuensis TaxID=200904 RepID=UPI0009A7BF36|nr:hypothetical protein [Paraliobacillus ryukyuensis]